MYNNFYLVYNVLIESPESTSFKVTTEISTIDFKNINTSNVTSFYGFLQGCEKLSTIKNLTKLDTSSTTNMSNMFRDCKNLQKIDFSNFNTSNVTNMSYMFYGDGNLTELDLSNFNTSNVTAMNQMFYNCSSLTEILGELDASKVTNIQTSNASNMVLEKGGCIAWLFVICNHVNIKNSLYFLLILNRAVRCFAMFLNNAMIITNFIKSMLQR